MMCQLVSLPESSSLYLLNVTLFSDNDKVSIRVDLEFARETLSLREIVSRLYYVLVPVDCYIVTDLCLL